MHYIGYTPDTPDVAWNGYWPGVLNEHGVGGPTFFCPSASVATSNDRNKGYGNVSFAWTGQYTSAGSGIKFNNVLFRESSYGYNRYLTAGNWSGRGGGTHCLSGVKNSSEAPAFLDCAYADVQPELWNELDPPKPPPDLRGETVKPGVP
jgi:hypothetical protein